MQTTREKMDNFTQALQNFVDREYDTQTAQVLDMWRRPLGERVAEGEAIADVQVVRVEHPLAWLRCRENPAKFRPPDTLRLNRGNPFDPLCYSCELEEERDTTLVIRAGFRVNFYGLRPGPGWVLDREVVDVRFLLRGVLDQLADGSPHSQQVLSILQGRVQPQFDYRTALSAYEMARRLSLDASQVEALARGLSTQDFFLIQGPPGTGKTYVLAYMAARLAQQGERVLITAFTHRAISNALRKIAKVTGFNRVAKIGQRLHADDLTWETGSVPNYEHFADSPFQPDGTGYILGGTCFAVRTSRLREAFFDTVIFDEAGQLTLPLAAAGMLAGRRYIFIGDHKQMAPIIVAEHEPQWLARSLFENLFEVAPGTMLTTTYRMNAEINAYPSQRFYEGRIHPSDEARNRFLRLGGSPGRFDSLLRPSPGAIFVAVDHRGKGMRAPQEADIAAGIVAEAVGRGLPPAEIAVVAPYRAQVREIRAALRKLHIDPDGDGVVVDTVERIQGQERDVIVVSLTTSDPAHAAQRAEFYFQPNRLNVAITRPRTKRIVIGSPRLFDAQPSDPEHRRWVDHFRGLYEASHVVAAR